jgi:hypothetical protein
MAVVALAIPATVQASPKGIQEILMGSEIRGLIIGNTLSGQTAKSGAFAEFYNRNGTIQGTGYNGGAGYNGTWTIENNALCLKITGDDTSKKCWKFGRDGDSFQLLLDGKVVGTGSITPGNPNDL